MVGKNLAMLEHGQPACQTQKIENWVTDWNWQPIPRVQQTVNVRCLAYIDKLLLKHVKSCICKSHPKGLLYPSLVAQRQQERMSLPSGQASNT